MNNRLWLAAGALGVLLAAFPAPAYAQRSMKLTVAFPFTVGQATHPAGDYRFTVTEGKAEVRLTPAKGTPSFAMVESRLAQDNSETPVDRVVFDKVGDRYYLSELWFTGEDGYLMYAAKEPHTHHTIKAEKTAK
jgi:hypothetical protein